MPVTNNVANAMPADDLAALDAALADFDLDSDDGAIVEPDMTVEGDELAELTLAEVNPAMAELRPLAAKLLESAHSSAEETGRAIGKRLASSAA